MKCTAVYSFKGHPPLRVSRRYQPRGEGRRREQAMGEDLVSALSCSQCMHGVQPDRFWIPMFLQVKGGRGEDAENWLLPVYSWLVEN